MVTVNHKTINTLPTYIILLNDNNTEVVKAYLFGSYPNCKNKELSDIDSALISDMFSGDNYNDRNMISKITVSIDDRLEPHTFNTSDFNESNPFTGEIINTGIRIL